MATKKGEKFAVGNLNSRHVISIPETLGGENMENFTLAMLSFNASGERVATQLDAETKAGYLVCSDEVRYDGEQYFEFYNAVGEFVRLVHLEVGLRFETSAYTGVPVVGKFAHWNPATKKFAVADITSLTARNSFLIVDVNEADYTLGLPTVRLEVVK